MFQDGGPSRSGPPYAPPKMPLNGPGPANRPAPSRWDSGYDYGRDRDDRSNGYGRLEPSSSRPYLEPPHPRPPRREGDRSAPEGRANLRTRTPSPPRRPSDRGRELDSVRDRDRGFYSRDRASLDTGRERPDGQSSEGLDALPSRKLGSFTSAPQRDRGADRDWDRAEREWPERKDDRIRDSRPTIISGRVSPSKGPGRFATDRWSPPDAPRGPRALTVQTPTSLPPPSRIPSGPRSASNATSISLMETEMPGLQGRDLGKDFERPGPPGSAPSHSRRTASNPLVDPPKAPRSMRGSSSPVEVKRTTKGPSTYFAPAAGLPGQVKEEALETDLEEGEVVSPVRQDKRTWPSESNRKPRERTYARDPWSPRGESRGDVAWRRRRIGSVSPARRRRSPTPSRRINGQADRADIRRRSMSPVMVTRNSPQHPIPSSARSGTAQQLSNPPPSIEVAHRTERPPTPPDPPPTRLTNNVFPLHALAPDPSRPATPAFPPPSPAGTHASSSILKATTSMAEVSSVLAFEDDQLSAVDDSEKAFTPLGSHPAQRPSMILEDMKAAGADNQTAASGLGVSEAIPVQDTSKTELEDTPSSVRIAGSTTNPATISENPGALLIYHLTSTPPGKAQSGFEEHDGNAGFLAKQASSPPGHAAPTSPSESAVTPALLNTEHSSDVEIVMDDCPTQETARKQEMETIDFDDAKVQLKPDGEAKEAGMPVVVNASKRVTIAERRSVLLPVATGSLSSPFNAKFRPDLVPTGGSAQESVAAIDSGRKTAEMENNRPDTSDASQSGHDAATQGKLRAVIKSLQAEPFEIDLNFIAAWNQAAAPAASTRIPIPNSASQRETGLRELIRPMDQTQARVAKLVTTVVSRQRQQTEQRIRALRNEYLELDEDWRAHCEYLDNLIQRRGPPPADLYAMPGSMPLVTPGPVLITPVLEMDIAGASRLGRRRAGPGGGDAVATEAEFLELLAGFADNAAKDPTVRASKTTAVVPDMLPPTERQSRYHDENDLVSDPWAFYDIARTAGPIWTDEERTLFTRRFLAYPKQFGRIAEGLVEKTASECVVYYYRTKKTIDYKGMLAAKRGDKRKKSIQLKKGGKSSALLANLDRAKPTVSMVSVAPSMTTTPYRALREDSLAPSVGGKGGKGARGEIIPLTPDEIGGRKGMFSIDNAISNLPRAGEAPAPKLKTRTTLKNTKRPRVNSLADLNGLLTTMLPELDENGALIQPEPPIASQLLPPVKRFGKRRKITDPVEASDVASTSEKPSRRAATNSYWSVEEKKRFRDLLAVHGTDFRQIAAELGTAKSERQVANFFDAHKDEMKLEEVMPREALDRLSRMSMASAELDTRMSGVNYDRQALGPSPPKPGQFGRSIYDVYPRPMSGIARPTEMLERRYPSEPRLGMFPPAPHLAPPNHSRSSATFETYPLHARPPAQNVSRSGGMRISALLNDEPVQEPRSAESPYRRLPDVDAASDGTVSERDAEGGVTRPSPRSQLPILGAPYDRRLSESFDRPNLERLRAASAAPLPHEARQSEWREPVQSDYYTARPTTAVPVLPHARTSWEIPRPLQTAAGAAQFSHPSQQPPRAEPYRSISDGPRFPQHESYPARSAPGQDEEKSRVVLKQ